MKEFSEFCLGFLLLAVAFCFMVKTMWHEPILEIKSQINNGSPSLEGGGAAIFSNN